MFLLYIFISVLLQNSYAINTITNTNTVTSSNEVISSSLLQTSTKTIGLSESVHVPEKIGVLLLNLGGPDERPNVRIMIYISIMVYTYLMFFCFVCIY